MTNCCKLCIFHPDSIEKVQENPHHSILGEVAAFGSSSEILDQAAAYARSVGVENVVSRRAVFFGLPFPNNTFDVVHTPQMLCHLSTPLRALSEMLRGTDIGWFVTNPARRKDIAYTWPRFGALSILQVDLAVEVNRCRVDSRK